jgi:uncharacterized damage-inducible protein DinB
MDISYFRTLYDYHYWARDKLLDTVRTLSEAEYYARRPMDYGSIHATFVHGYAGDYVWYRRWHGESPPRLITPDDIPTIDELERRWKELEQQVGAFLEGLTDEDLRTRVVEYRNTEGIEATRMLWQTMAHLINHGTNHRSEVAAAATQLGHSPGDLDMTVFFGLRPPARASG